MSDDPATRPVVNVQPGRHKRAAQGHPWVYSNEIAMDAAAKALPPGTLVTLKAADGTALGVAMFNPHPLVSARILDRDAGRIVDAGFFAARLTSALTLRQRLYDKPFYRLIHAEADGLPGVIVDRFGDVLVVEVNTAGIDRCEAEFLAACDQVLQPRAIVLRNDSSARGIEGLPLAQRMIGNLANVIGVEENGGSFLADPLGGQKTGWFYDQRENRRAVAALASGARVLDLYCFTGGFGITAARAGAREVRCVDRSEPALVLARKALEDDPAAPVCQFERAEVFEKLENLAAARERFDIVIADPPAFVKSRKDLGPGLRGYRKLARLAAALVVPGGFLFIASCSHNVDVADFAESVRRGLHDAGRAGRILLSSGAAPDHPVHPFLPESAYLKAQLLALD
ncbi:MAG TPA: class I SAM-dependent rRNA methyltransferase [Stellaceae bacterium]|nr:class I SAM-dependent rRNA methyltransferase [Stellaceae bacterium]